MADHQCTQFEYVRFLADENGLLQLLRCETCQREEWVRKDLGPGIKQIIVTGENQLVLTRGPLTAADDARPESARRVDL